MGRLQGLVNDAGQVISDRVQVHRILQPGRERHYHLVGVIARPVELAVARWTRDRSGLNRAAAMSVDPATAAGGCR